MIVQCSDVPKHRLELNLCLSFFTCVSSFLCPLTKLMRSSLLPAAASIFFLWAAQCIAWLLADPAPCRLDARQTSTPWAPRQRNITSRGLCMHDSTSHKNTQLRLTPSIASGFAAFITMARAESITRRPVQPSPSYPLWLCVTTRASKQVKSKVRELEIMQAYFQKKKRNNADQVAYQ